MNTFGCYFDGGDCCGDDVNTEKCVKCICHCNATLRLIGNGFCNDETNTLECNFDGGDCCGACINTNLCTECVCHKPLAIDLSCKY